MSGPAKICEDCGGQPATGTVYWKAPRNEGPYDMCPMCIHHSVKNRGATEVVRFLSAETLSQDDLGDPITHHPGEVVWDAKTAMGPWATMTEKSFNLHAHKHVRENGGALGWGQKYVRWDNGWLVKVEG